jgi:hypothetical protein
MNKTFRRLCALLALAWVVIPAQAAVTLYNLTDQWWVPNESGWGGAISQQGNTLFVDIYVYDANSNPVWFTATAVLQGQESSNDYIYSGDLLATTGPYYGLGAFSPNGVTRTKVGTITLDVVSPTSIKMTYTVNGVAVSKTIVRQTFKTLDVAGNYFGGFVYMASGCTPAANNGPVNELATLLIGVNGSLVTVFAGSISGGSCNYTGNYGQDGQFASITGTFACSNGDTGPFTLSEIAVSRSGIGGQFTGSSQACSKLQGQFGGVRTTLN